MRSVVCVGGFHVDAKAVVAGPVIPGTSNPATVSRGPGGVACNVARTVVRLGVDAEAVGLVGGDDAGRDLRSILSDEGIGVAGLVQLEGAATATYTAVVDGDGALAMGIADMALYDQMDAAWAESLDLKADIVFVDANPTTDALDVIAKAVSGDRLVLDPVSVEKAPRLSAAARRGATVFPDLAEAAVLSGVEDADGAAAGLIAAGARRVVVSRGAHGVVDADAAGVRRVSAFQPSRVVDVTGAGDALVGGYLAALAHGESDPVEWGMAVASLAVESLATVPGDLDLDRLHARLAQRTSA